jgi:hypothetical protein
MVAGDVDPPCGESPLRVRVLVCQRGRYTQIAEEDRAIIVDQ